MLQWPKVRPPPFLDTLFQNLLFKHYNEHKTCIRPFLITLYQSLETFITLLKYTCKYNDFLLEDMFLVNTILRHPVVNITI